MKIIIAMGFTALLVSCSTTKETTSATANQNRGRSNVETISNTGSKTVENSRTARADASTIDSANRNAQAAEKARFKRMSTDLDMTDDQIHRFEREWKNTQNSWKRNNRSKAMNNYERVEYQDRILRDILNDSQFESYQKWVRDNADGN